MDLRVLGCHGGETSTHRCPAFLVDQRLALDAGAITGVLSLEEQRRIDTVLVTHAHLDHVRDLAMLSDTRTQQGGPPLTVASTPGTIQVLREHFFNDRLWPDFSRIPNREAPTLIYRELQPGQTTQLGEHHVTPVMVDHTVEACAFIVERGAASLAYTGDTGPTERLWVELEARKNLKALIMEVAFPNDQAALARISGHHTPESLELELKKLPEAHRDLPVLLFHIKPVFQQVVERELARIKARNNTILNLGDEYLL